MSTACQNSSTPTFPALALFMTTSTQVEGPRGHRHEGDEEPAEEHDLAHARDLGVAGEPVHENAGKSNERCEIDGHLDLRPLAALEEDPYTVANGHVFGVLAGGLGFEPR